MNIRKTKYEKYLDHTEKKERMAITKLRLSSHNLPIEQLRYQQVSREERTCSICDTREVGDEVHYLVGCGNEVMTTIRRKFRDEVEKAQPQFEKLSMSNIIHYCLKTHDTATFTPFGKYVHSILQVYDDEVDKQIEEATKCPIM